MNYGLYLSANGVQTSMHRQDVLANNLANVETVGFKPDRVATRERLVERLESGLPIEPQLLLERLGGGHLVAPTLVDLGQGPLEHTSNPLDVAIEGDGLFVVSGTGGDDVRLTRDGRFTLAADGTLRAVASGREVLDTERRPIQLDATKAVTIDRAGDIRQEGRSVARIAIVTASPEELAKDAGSLLRFRGASPGALTPADGAARQGYVEASSVDPIVTLNRLTTAAKAVQANAKLMQYHDFIMGQAIGTFGRVA